MGKFLLVVIVFAAVVYACFYLYEKARARSAGRASGRPRPTPRRTFAPDDDEDFLRDLNRRRRKDEGSPPNDS